MNQETISKAKAAHQLIEPEEAIELFRYARFREAVIAKNLYNFYRSQMGTNSDRIWSFLEALTFIYYTGRIQGIREERAKRGGSSNE